MRGANKYLAYSHLGLTFALILAGSVFLGFKADERFGTSPLFVLLGCLVGFGAAFFFLYREVYGPKAESKGPHEGGEGQV